MKENDNFIQNTPDDVEGCWGCLYFIIFFGIIISMFIALAVL